MWQRLLHPFLNHAIVHVTDRCNYRCKSCFINFGKNDLSVEQARTLSRKLGRIAALDIGGGEPFMHASLFEIVREFRFGEITIPTNGFYKDKILETAEKLLDVYPRRVTMAVSLDGPAELNDELRGPRSFARARETFDALRRLKGLKLKVNTVVSNRNIDVLPDFVREVKSWGPDYHSLLLLRGDPLAPDEISTPPAARLREVTPALYDALRGYTYGHNRLLGAFMASYQRYMWKVSVDMLEKRSAPFQCHAPHFNKVIYSDGQASMCELKPRLGSFLDEERPAVEAKLHAHLKAFEREHGRCYCTHNCVILENIFTHPPSVLRVAAGAARK